MAKKAMINKELKREALVAAGKYPAVMRSRTFWR
jgi:hypothetical protein